MMCLHKSSFQAFDIIILMKKLVLKIYVLRQFLIVINFLKFTKIGKNVVHNYINDDRIKIAWVKIKYFENQNMLDKSYNNVYTLNVKIFYNQKFIEIKGDKSMLEKMKEIVAEQLSCDASEVEMTTNFKEDLGADSLDLFELVMALEEEYSVEIPSEDLANINTVEDVINYLKGKGIEA